MVFRNDVKFIRKKYSLDRTLQGSMTWKLHLITAIPFSRYDANSPKQNRNRQQWHKNKKLFPFIHSTVHLLNFCLDETDRMLTFCSILTNLKIKVAMISKRVIRWIGNIWKFHHYSRFKSCSLVRITETFIFIIYNMHTLPVW